MSISMVRRGDKKIPWGKGRNISTPGSTSDAVFQTEPKGELEQRELPRVCNGLGSIRGSELREDIGDVFPRG